LLPLLLLVIVGIFSFSIENVQWTVTPTSDMVARTSVLLIFAYSGIESALVPSGEVINPARTIPRAIFVAMASVTALYVVIHLVAQSALGSALATSPTPLADAASALMGPWGRTLLLCGAVVSMGGYVSGMTLAVPRALFAFGRDGFLPRAMASVHPRYHTPYVAIIVQSTLVCALAITSAFEELAILANLATLLLYGGCCLASWQLRRKNIEADGKPFRVPAAGTVSIVAILIIGWILTSVTAEEWAVVGTVTLASIVVYFLAQLRGKSGGGTSS
jgi:basic amino acid/polyamine antiporter, APA family